ncbi:hypothetical protein BH23CHL5_BH23CHL5_23090 [soil metagenome]
MTEGVNKIQPGQPVPVTVETLEQQRASLEVRLTEGYFRIEEALEAGQDVATWERFWIELLHQYELICAQLGRAAF